MANHSPSPLLIAAAYLLANVGLALTLTPVSAAALSALPPRLYGHGSSIISTVQPLSAATAVAVFISIISNKQHAQLALGDTCKPPALLARTTHSSPEPSSPSQASWPHASFAAPKRT